MTDLVAALRRRGYINLFLDGRNEWGTHVLTMPGNAVGDGLAEIEADLANQEDGLAAKIFAEAYSLGFQQGDMITAVWRWNDPQIEREYPCGQGFDERTDVTYGARTYESAPGYWEYERISMILTIAMYGSADEQHAARLAGA